MPSDKKTIREYEIAGNLMLLGKVDLDKEVTEAEFLEMAHPDKVIGVLHDDRSEWLERNGYEVTRQNMQNPDLAPNLEAQVEYDTKQKKSE